MRGALRSLRLGRPPRQPLAGHLACGCGLEPPAAGAGGPAARAAALRPGPGSAAAVTFAAWVLA
eukprot:7256524-Lingulodinium_polyedra.AAC.1